MDPPNPLEPGIKVHKCVKLLGVIQNGQETVNIFYALSN